MMRRKKVLDGRSTFHINSRAAPLDRLTAEGSDRQAGVLVGLFVPLELGAAAPARG
jgi:hypothetical protein